MARPGRILRRGRSVLPRSLGSITFSNQRVGAVGGDEKNINVPLLDDACGRPGPNIQPGATAGRERNRVVGLSSGGVREEFLGLRSQQGGREHGRGAKGPHIEEQTLVNPNQLVKVPLAHERNGRPGPLVYGELDERLLVARHDVLCRWNGQRETDRGSYQQTANRPADTQ